MKNKFTFILLPLLFTLTTILSQSVAIGLKGGLNFSKNDGEFDGYNYADRLGFNTGLFALLKFSKIGIQPEILYSVINSKFDTDTSNGPLPYKSNFNYLNIPIILKWYYVGGLNLYVGPQFGFLTGGQIKSSVRSFDVKDRYDDFVFAAAVGVGWDLPFGLMFDARYTHDIKNLKSKSIYSEWDITNKVIQVSLGYKIFKLGKK